MSSLFSDSMKYTAARLLKAVSQYKSLSTRHNTAYHKCSSGLIFLSMIKNSVKFSSFIVANFMLNS